VKWSCLENRFTDRRSSPSVTQLDVTLLMPDLADNGAPLTNCPVASRPSLKVRLPVSIATTSGRPTCHSKNLLDGDHPFTLPESSCRRP
jgi:hypothetical protein